MARLLGILALFHLHQRLYVAGERTSVKFRKIIGLVPSVADSSSLLAAEKAGGPEELMRHQVLERQRREQEERLERLAKQAKAKPARIQAGRTVPEGSPSSTSQGPVDYMQGFHQQQQQERQREGQGNYVGGRFVAATAKAAAPEGQLDRMYEFRRQQQQERQREGQGYYVAQRFVPDLPPSSPAKAKAAGASSPSSLQQ